MTARLSERAIISAEFDQPAGVAYGVRSNAGGVSC